MAISPSKKPKKPSVRRAIERSHLYGDFEITSLCRQDLINAGFDTEAVSQLTNREMENIAAEMADQYCEQMFQSSLQDIVQILHKNIPWSKPDEEEED